MESTEKIGPMSVAERMKRIGPPVKVHPTIKLFRWIFLISGIMYAVKRKKELSALVQRIKLEKENMKTIKDDFLEVEKDTIEEESVESVE